MPGGSDVDHTRELERLLVSQVRDYAIFALDVSGVIRTWNAGAEALKGYPAHEAIGRNFSMFYTRSDQQAGLPQQLLERAAAAGRVEHKGWRVRKDRTRFWGDVVITALRGADGELVGFAKVVRDLTEQHALQISLRASEEHFRALVSQVVDYAIISLDPQGVIRSWNSGAERVKGWTESEALGQHFSIFYVPDDREHGLPRELLQRARDEGSVAHTGWRMRKDGSRFWGDVVITALHDPSGELIGYSKVTRDRTEAHRLEEIQASLFATISHDLRTPLTTIGAYANLIADVGHDERVEFAERILSNAERLEDLVTGLFDYAKLRAGATTVSLEAVPVLELFHTSLTDHESALHGREITVRDGGLTVVADRNALRRVLDNLITNATRYSPTGSPITLAADAAGDRVLLTVTDRGRGIDADDLPLIFSEFVRGRLAEDDGGTGLGLASVRQLVTLQGGRVRAESVVGQGTTMTVELARAEGSRADP